MTLTVGLLVNPVAGIGGPAALKGSDGSEAVATAKAAGFESRVPTRVAAALDVLSGLEGEVVFATWAGAMGEDLLEGRGFGVRVLGAATDPLATTPADSRRAARALSDHGCDLLLFAGGDGTARDVFDAVPPGQLTLGIPSGVKMHSGVFANTPAAAGEILREIIEGSLTSVHEAEVRDIDEAAFREGVVRARFYGELTVPTELRYLQATKVGGRESEPLVLNEIAAEVIEHLEPGRHYFMGSGGTVAAIMEALSLPNTLLGVDVICDGELRKADANALELAEIARAHDTGMVITVIGGQGHLFGRGNQQLSPAVIRVVGPENITVVATKSKLSTLEGRPLIVDTGDRDLDRALSGLQRIVTGYEDAVIYRVG